MFTIQLTSTYRLRIDNFNITLMKKRSKKTNGDFIEDDEGDDNFGALGYYSKGNLKLLLTTLVNDKILSNASKKLISLKEFEKLVSDTSDELLKRMKPVMIADESMKLIAQKNKDIQDLKTQIKCLKRKNTLLGKKQNGDARKIS